MPDTNGQPPPDDFAVRLAQLMGKPARAPSSGSNGAAQAAPSHASGQLGALAGGLPGTADGQPAGVAGATAGTAGAATASQAAPQPSQARQEQRPSKERPEPAPGRGPVGSGEHVVEQGECVASIAKETGHFWQTIWDDPANADLREAREDPYILLPGDRVHVPPLRKKWETGQSEMRHRFVRKGQPEVFRVRVLRDGEPRGNEPYTLDVDGTVHEGTTDADGKLSCAIAANARRAKLCVGAESDVDEYCFRLGAIDPIDELSGVQGRLNNLGFDCGPADGKWGPHTERALKAYQGRRKLPVTGQPDEATRAKLLEDFGS